MAIISKYNNQQTNDDLVNEKIRFKEVLVIDQNGDQLGVMSRNQALHVVLWTMENIVLNNKRNKKK